MYDQSRGVPRAPSLLENFSELPNEQKHRKLNYFLKLQLKNILNKSSFSMAKQFFNIRTHLFAQTKWLYISSYYSIISIMKRPAPKPLPQFAT